MLRFGQYTSFKKPRDIANVSALLSKIPHKRLKIFKDAFEPCCSIMLGSHLMPIVNHISIECQPQKMWDLFLSEMLFSGLHRNVDDCAPQPCEAGCAK